MAREKESVYNKPVVLLRRRILKALGMLLSCLPVCSENAYKCSLRWSGSLCRDKILLRAEAFQRRSGREVPVKVTPTTLLAQVVSMFSDIEAQAPRKSAPVLGLDLKFKK